MNELRWSEVRCSGAALVDPGCAEVIAPPPCSATNDLPDVTPGVGCVARSAARSTGAAGRSLSAFYQSRPIVMERRIHPGARPSFTVAMPETLLADPSDVASNRQPADHQHDDDRHDTEDHDLSGCAVEPGHRQHEEQERQGDEVGVRSAGQAER